VSAAYMLRKRKHLCNLARKWLRRNAVPIRTVHRYSHILDKQCLRKVLDIANVLHPNCAETLINAVIPYVPHKWLRDMDPKQVIRTPARFILPIDKVIAGIDSRVISATLYGPILGAKYDWLDRGSHAISAVGAARYAYKYLVGGRRIDHMWELKNLIGLIGHGGNRPMLIRALKIWNERKHDFITDNCVIYVPDNARYPECHYDFIAGGVVFSLPSKYAITAMDFIMAEYCGRGVCIDESAIYHLLYNTPCLHYKVWNFVINLILDALPHVSEHRQRIVTTVRAMLHRGHLYARLPRSTLSRIVTQLPAVVTPRMFSPRDVIAAKLSTVGSSL